MTISALPLLVTFVLDLSELDYVTGGQSNPQDIINFVLSLTCDYLSIILLRKVFVTVSSKVPLSRLIVSAVFLTLYPFALVAFSQLVQRGYDPSAYAGDLRYWAFGRDFWHLNFFTILLCLIPDLFLLVMVGHGNNFWPFLSRSVFALQRFNIVTNKKFLTSVGTLAFSHAFNLDTLGLKTLLTLMGKVHP